MTEVTEITVNLDDVTPQVVGDTQQRLLAEGALDVWTMPIAMKKQRPAVMLCALVESARGDHFARRMLELTGSFGVRMRSWQRLTLERRHETVETALGAVRIKVGTLDGRVLVARPEFEDVAALSRQTGRPLHEVMQAADAAAFTWRQSQEAVP